METMYYVAKQAEKQWGVYYTSALGDSKQAAMFTTKREAIAESMKLNSFHRIEMQQARERAAAEQI